MYEIMTANGEKIKNLSVRADGEINAVSYLKRNYIIKDAGNGNFEMIVYKNGFFVPEYKSLSENNHNDGDYENSSVFSDLDDITAFKSFASTKKFYRREDGVAVSKVENGCRLGTFEDFCKSFVLGSKRAIKNFFDYALTNNWEYFVTLTFRDKEIRDSKKLMSDSWQKFIAVLRRKTGGQVKAIATYEEFEKGGFHIHALLSNVDLSLVPARNNKQGSPEYGNFIYSEFGPQLMNCTDWNLGFNTVVCLRPDSENANIVGYMSKYMNKNCPSDWGLRRFYRTQNLTARKSFIAKGTQEEFDEYIDDLGLVFVKEDKKGNKYYRNY